MHRSPDQVGVSADGSLSRPRDGDDFAAWDEAHRPRLHAWCTRYLGDHAAAEDVVQETLLRAWTHRERFAPDEDISPWLYRVARNLCVDTVRGRTRTAVMGDLPEPPDLESDPVNRVVDLEEYRSVRNALAAMSSRQQDLLVMRDVEEASYDQVASRMGITLQGARVALHRARRSLRDALVAGGAFGALSPMPALGRLLAAIRREAEQLAPQQPVSVATELAVLALVAALAGTAAPGTVDPSAGEPTSPAPTAPGAGTTSDGSAADPLDGAPQVDADVRTPADADELAADPSEAITGWSAHIGIGGRRTDDGPEGEIVGVDVSADAAGRWADPLDRLPDIDVGILQRSAPEAP